MIRKSFFVLIFAFLCFATFSCRNSSIQNQETSAPPSALRNIPALKLNYRFESDVPAPSVVNQQALAEEKNAALQNDFDTNRPQQILEKTFTSPDKQRVVAAYRIVGDSTLDYRLDMYTPDGKLLRRITPNGMAVRFPDTIVWSPDSSNVAFVAVGRASLQPNAAPSPETSDAQPNANLEVDTNSNAEAASSPTAAAPDAAANVLTFRTEQIYLSNKEGAELKPLTQNEGLIYFYYVWSPDSSTLASLAATWREWDIGQSQANLREEIFIPSGRLRLIEKNGRQRLLSDNVTIVHPVWSPDSSKVADAFDKEVRIYDAAISDAPTQAAIPLRNQLLISSKAYDNQKKRETENGNANSGANVNSNAEANTNVNANTSANTNINANGNSSQSTGSDTSSLPDENTLVSFNPIVELKWTEDTMLYLRTAYVKEMKNPSDSVHSFARWHRLIFSPQASALN